MQKRPSFSIFEFTGATGLEIEQTQSPRFRIFKTDDMELLKEARGAGKTKRGGLARPPPLGAPPKAFWASDVRFASIFVPSTWFDLKTAYIRFPRRVSRTYGGGDRKHQNRESAGRRRRKIGGGTAAGITSGRLSSFTNASSSLSMMRGE